MGNVSNLDSLANVLGCNISYLPMKYLGQPLEASFTTVYLGWSIEKIEHRLAVGRGCICWKVVGSS